MSISHECPFLNILKYECNLLSRCKSLDSKVEFYNCLLFKLGLGFNHLTVFSISFPVFSSFIFLRIRYLFYSSFLLPDQRGKSTVVETRHDRFSVPETDIDKGTHIIPTDLNLLCASRDLTTNIFVFSSLSP